MFPLPFKLVYLAFVILLVPVYAVEHGWLNFLWLSNVALIGGLVAAWLEDRRLASMLLVAVAMPELAWVVDFVLSLILGGSAPLGIVHYMYNPEIPLFVRLLSLYHLPLPFVLIWMVWRLGYDPDAWKPWLAAGWAILLLTYLLSAPDQNVNWVWGPVGEPQQWMPPIAWLGLVMVICGVVWWVTHRIAMFVFRRTGRIDARPV